MDITLLLLPKMVTKKDPMICTSLWSVGGGENGLDLDWGDIGWWEQVVYNFCVGERREQDLLAF